MHVGVPQPLLNMYCTVHFLLSSAFVVIYAIQVGRAVSVGDSFRAAKSPEAVCIHWRAERRGAVAVAGRRAAADAPHVNVGAAHCRSGDILLCCAS